MLNALLGQGGAIFFAARRRSLLAEHTLFQVARSATNGRIKLAIKCRGILGIDKGDACWARDADADADGQGSSSCAVTPCRLLAVDDDSPRIGRLFIAILYICNDYLLQCGEAPML
jgi:hypothetical protein